MKYRLGNICKIGDGLHGTPNYCKNNEFYFINGNNLKGELIDLSNARSVSKAEYLKYNPNLIPQKTVLLSINGTLGNTAIYNGESIILSKSVAFFECSTDIITPEYLKLYFESCNFQNILNNMATGTTIKNVGLKSLRSLMIDLPSINIQREIVNIIKPFENKLYLNNQINDNLISLATALFNKYFPNINSGNEMIGNFISNYDRLRKPLSKKERLSIPGKYRYIGATSVNDYINKYNFDGIYLLLGEDGTVEDDNGYPILQYISGKFWPNNHAHVLQGKNVSTEWLYLFFKQRKITSIVTGAVQKKISQKNLNSLSISIPDKDKLARFDTIINPIFKNIRIIESENHSLEKIKVELLSKLF